jgi:putative sigma-54 modulation protein
VQITIKSRNLVMSEHLKTLTTEKISRLSKYLEGMDHADITFFEEKNKRIAAHEVCEVVLFGHGHYVRAKATAPEAHAAVDLVVDKLAHQLTKLKGRVVTRHHSHSHHNGAARVNGVKAAKGSTAVLEAAPLLALSPDEDLARIVRKKQFVMSPMTTDEAALQLDLLQHDFYLFTNADTGRTAVLYRREDGHLGLIDAA